MDKVTGIIKQISVDLAKELLQVLLLLLLSPLQRERAAYARQCPECLQQQHQQRQIRPLMCDPGCSLGAARRRGHSPITQREGETATGLGRRDAPLPLGLAFILVRVG